MTELADGEIFIVKIGTASILDKDGQIDQRVLDQLVDDVAELHTQGKKVVIVTSGARELGRWKEGDDDPGTAAAIGQGKLIGEYIRRFEKHGLEVGQYLIDTRHFDIAHDSPDTGVVHAIVKAWERGAIPVLNENDPFAIEAITLKDNDNATKKVALALKDRGYEVAGVVLMSVENGTEEQKQMGKGGAEEKAVVIAALQEESVPVYVVPGKGEHPLKALFEMRDALLHAQRNADAMVVNNGGRVHPKAHRLAG